MDAAVVVQSPRVCYCYCVRVCDSGAAVSLASRRPITHSLTTAYHLPPLAASLPFAALLASAWPHSSRYYALLASAHPTLRARVVALGRALAGAGAGVGAAASTRISAAGLVASCARDTLEQKCSASHHYTQPSPMVQTPDTLDRCWRPDGQSI